MTASSHTVSTVENILHRQVNLVTKALPRNLDAISERRQGTVRPAASTVLRNVLVETLGQVARAVNVAPRKGGG